MNDLYNPQKFQKPANLIPPGKYDGIEFGNLGFPDLVDESLGKKYFFNKNVQGNYGSDFREATDWLIKQPDILEIKELPIGSLNPIGSPILVKLKGSNKFVKITWHHHQDGKTLLPVFSDIHDKILGKHTGGVAIKSRNLEGFFVSP